MEWSGCSSGTYDDVVVVVVLLVKRRSSSFWYCGCVGEFVFFVGLLKNKGWSIGDGFGWGMKLGHGVVLKLVSLDGLGLDAVRDKHTAGWSP